MRRCSADDQGKQPAKMGDDFAHVESCAADHRRQLRPCGV